MLEWSAIDWPDMRKRKSGSSLPRSPLPEPLRKVLKRIIDTPPEVRDFEWGYSVLAALLNPAGCKPPSSEMKCAHERSCCGSEAAINDLRRELQKVEEKAMCQRLARMTPAEKRQVLLHLGKAFLMIMSCQRSEPQWQFPPEVMEGLLNVD
jgi:hypothetical protein